ncbi:MAG: hypothetical protein CMH83_02825 [Nocardioides sp.]|nr:hypothetical protein [Nocardioides sp.]
MTLPHRTSRARLLPARTGLAALAVVAAAGLLAGCGEDPTTTAADTGEATPAETASSEPAEETTSEPAPAEETTTAGTTVPVYFTGDSPQGTRLYREFRQVDGDPLTAAAQLLVSGDALDPDYGTLLGDLSVDSVTDDGSTITVALSEDTALTLDKSAPPADAEVAVQSLVYTLQGVAGSREPVVVEQAGTPVDLLGQPTSTGVEAADELDVLALVNVTSPESGAALSGTVTVSGVASSFEATVPWEVRNDSGASVLSGFATAEGWIDGLYPWESEVDLSGLAPGDYTFAAMTDDPSGGAEGPGPYEDTKAITVG